MLFPHLLGSPLEDAQCPVLNCPIQGVFPPHTVFPGCSIIHTSMRKAQFTLGFKMTYFTSEAIMRVQLVQLTTAYVTKATTTSCSDEVFPFNILVMDSLMFTQQKMHAQMCSRPTLLFGPDLIDQVASETNNVMYRRCPGNRLTSVVAKPHHMVKF